MAIMTAIAIAGLALSAGGLAMSVMGQKAAASASQQALQEQQQLEAQRQQQMNLDAERRKREIVRQQVSARSTALAAATGGNAQFGSGVGGAYGGISGRTNVNELGVNQNQMIGNTEFGINNNILNSYRSASSAESSAMLGGGLESLGGAMMRNEGTISKVGTYFSSSFFGGGAGGDSTMKGMEFA